MIDEIAHSEFKAYTMLRSSRTRAVESPDPQIITVSQETILASQANLAGPSSFELALDRPRILIQEQAFPLILRLSDKHIGTISSSAPEIQLKSCLVQLLAGMFVRGTGNTED